MVAEDETFPVHRVVLAAASPYFQAMFTGGFRENELDVIKLKEVSSEGLECIIDAIYSAEIMLSGDNVAQVLQIANMWQMSDVIKVCETFLADHVAENNCSSFLSVAEKFELTKAISSCNTFILDHFQDVSKTQEFNKLTLEKLTRYLEDDLLKVSNGEIEVFRAVVRWLEQNDLGDLETLTELIKLVRFPQIPADVLIDEVLQVPVIEDNRECRKLVIEALRFHTNVHAQPLQEDLSCRPRGHKNLLIITNGTREQGSYAVQQHEIELHVMELPREGTPLCSEIMFNKVPLSFAYRSLGVVTKGNYLFLFGTVNRLYHPTALRYDVSSDKWLELKAPPWKATIGSSCARHVNDIYLIGGMNVLADTSVFNPSNNTAKTISYSIGQNKWSTRCNLPQALAYHATATHRNVIYVGGGARNDGSGGSAALYAYDILGKLWLTKAAMHYGRYSFCLETINDSIYACGGLLDETTSVKSIEVYNVLDDQWTVLHTMSRLVPYMSTTVPINENLYLIGGLQKDNNKYIVQNISCLNVERNTLTEVSRFPFSCYGHVSALLTVPRK